LVDWGGVPRKKVRLGTVKRADTDRAVGPASEDRVATRTERYGMPRTDVGIQGPRCIFEEIVHSRRCT